jgi:hypothetical protein
LHTAEEPVLGAAEADKGRGKLGIRVADEVFEGFFGFEELPFEKQLEESILGS